MGPRRGMMPGSTSATMSQDHKGILGKPNYKFQSKMTLNELEEHREKSQCFFCHERFATGHMYPQRQRAQVFFMDVNDPIGDQEEHTKVAVESKAEKEEEAITVTLNYLFGNTCNDVSTMRVMGSLGNKMLHILISTGSSHNFLRKVL